MAKLPDGYKVDPKWTRCEQWYIKTPPDDGTIVTTWEKHIEEFDRLIDEHKRILESIEWEE